MKAEMAFCNIVVAEGEKMVTFMGDQNAACDHLHKLVAALRRIFNVQVEKKNKKAYMFFKVKIFREQS